MVKSKGLNKPYLGLALGVSISTLGGPFLSLYPRSNDGILAIRPNSSLTLDSSIIPYVLGLSYFGVFPVCHYIECSRRNNSGRDSDNYEFEGFCNDRIPLGKLLDVTDE